MALLYSPKIPRLLTPFSRFAVRFHISLILLGTLASGWVFGRLLLLGGFSYMPLRYLFSTLCAYGIFIALSSLWLKYLGRRSKISSRRQLGFDADFPADFSGLPDSLPTKSGSLEEWSGDGGNFSGAGASGHFDGGSDWSVDAGAVVPDLPDASFDADDLVSAIIGAIIFVIVFVLFTWGAYLLFEVPMLFIEGIFHGILTAALIKATKRIDDEDWTTSVFKQTRWIAATVLAATLAAGFYVEYKCPVAQKLSDAFTCKSS